MDYKKNKWNSYSSYIRRYLFEKYNNKCARCGWGEKINIQILFH